MTEMALDRSAAASIPSLDDATRQLVRLAAILSIGSEREMRAALVEAAAGPAEPLWVEEVILQGYLFAGFPRTLNAAREWRRASGRPAPSNDEGEDPEAHVTEWRDRGEATCAVVYGPFYERLRRNIHELHPALDAWMIVDGYGKILGRPGLELWRRELCVVAVCAASRQDRQLHSHLHGALHAGASAAQLRETLTLVEDMLHADDVSRFRHLLARVVHE